MRCRLDSWETLDPAWAERAVACCTQDTWLPGSLRELSSNQLREKGLVNALVKMPISHDKTSAQFFNMNFPAAENSGKIAELQLWCATSFSPTHFLFSTITSEGQKWYWATKMFYTGLLFGHNTFGWTKHHELLKLFEAVHQGGDDIYGNSSAEIYCGENWIEAQRPLRAFDIQIQVHRTQFVLCSKALAKNRRCCMVRKNEQFIVHFLCSSWTSGGPSPSDSESVFSFCCGWGVTGIHF